MVKNAYIHIPFCNGKCNYCSFVSFDNVELITKYLQSLKNEIFSVYKSEPLSTLYFGGGTPSLLTHNQLSQIIKLFNIDKDAEITCELNPESADEKYFNGLQDTKINRISIGAQSFDDKILSLIGRKHSSNQIIESLSAAQNAGFNNINLDLIYGLPTQSIELFEEDLIKAINLGVQHISLYGLKIEPRTYFYDNPPKALPDIDVQADMYLRAVEILKQSGFNHYEISNFSKQGFESRHNLNYWNNSSYYGFGTSASGYIDGLRYTNCRNLIEYIQNPSIRHSAHILSTQVILEEEIFLGLRKSSGINIAEINKKFKIDFMNDYKDIVQKYEKYFSKNKKNLALNLEGMMICNEIMAEFIDLN